MFFIFDEVESVFGKEVALGRNIKMFLCQRYTGEKLKDIGIHFGIGESGVSQACRRVKYLITLELLWRIQMEQDTPENPTINFIGAWRLISSEIRESKGKVIQQDAVGCLIYDEHGYMSAQSFKSDAQLKGTPEEIKSVFEGFVSYFGTYEVNRQKGTVVHHIEGSMLPFPNVGTNMERFFKFSGNRLTLTTPPTQIGDREAVFVFIWERFE